MLHDIYPQIPANLKTLPYWVGFHVYPDPERPGKLKKDPINVKTGQPAKSNDPSTWTMYTEALAAIETGKCGINAIGFGFPLDGSIGGVDIDHCVDLSSGKVDPDARRIIDHLDSYTETSVSGTGVHILVRGYIRDTVKQEIEIYRAPRFFVFTGNHVAGTPLTVQDRSREIAQLCDEYRKPEPERSATAPAIKPNGMEDEELIAKAERSKNGDKFKQLRAGDFSGYESQSEADLAYCKILAFWTGNDAQRMDTLFRQSGLIREKWNKHPYYAQETIRKAIEATPQPYDPDFGKKADEKARAFTAANAPAATGLTGIEKASDAVDKVIAMLEKAYITAMSFSPPEYLDDPFIVKNAITAFTGGAGEGKSTFVISRLIGLAAKEPDCYVIYADRDNPASIAKERMKRLCDSNPDRIRYWGGFLTDSDGSVTPPWDIEDPRWLTLIAKLNTAGKHVLIVFDTLNSFMNGQNENDNAVMGNIVNCLRRMTHAGATCILIHHTGKSETSKKARGASSFEGGVDAAWLVEARIMNCAIETLTLTAWKSRLGKLEPHTFRMVDGRPVESHGNSLDAAVFAFISKHEGLTKEGLEKAAKQSPQGYSRQLVRDTVEKYMVAGRLKVVDHKIYLAESVLANIQAANEVMSAA